MTTRLARIVSEPFRPQTETYWNKVTREVRMAVDFSYRHCQIYFWVHITPINLITQAAAAVRTIFRDLGDTDAGKCFITKYIEPMQSSVDNNIDVDTLMYMLMAEWSRLRDQNTKDLTSLFRAGDRNNDGRLNYDELLDAVKYVLPRKNVST